MKIANSDNRGFTIKKVTSDQINATLKIANMIAKIRRHQGFSKIFQYHS